MLESVPGPRPPPNGLAGFMLAHAPFRTMVASRPRGALAWAVLALLLPGCSFPGGAGPGTTLAGCVPTDAREPGHDAPPVPFLQGDWEEVLDRFLALVGDAA